MDQFIFGSVSKESVPELCELYFQLTGDHPDPKRTAALLDVIEANPDYHLFGVFSQGGKLIATLSISRCFDLTNDGRFYFSLENLVVDEAYRHQGIGTFLMKKAEDFVTSQGGRYLCFNSAFERTEAHRFYASLGYRDDYVKGFKRRFYKSNTAKR